MTYAVQRMAYTHINELDYTPRSKNIQRGTHDSCYINYTTVLSKSLCTILGIEATLVQHCVQARQRAMCTHCGNAEDKHRTHRYTYGIYAHHCLTDTFHDGESQKRCMVNTTIQSAMQTSLICARTNQRER